MEEEQLGYRSLKFMFGKNKGQGEPEASQPARDCFRKQRPKIKTRTESQALSKGVYISKS